MKSFAERIRQLRKESGLTQRELAAFVGVSTSAVGFCETGAREVPNGNNLLKLGEAFGLNPVEFMRTGLKGAQWVTR